MLRSSMFSEPMQSNRRFSWKSLSDFSWLHRWFRKYIFSEPADWALLQQMAGGDLMAIP
jgi:hypothetical protein